MITATDAARRHATMVERLREPVTPSPWRAEMAAALRDCLTYVVPTLREGDPADEDYEVREQAAAEFIRPIFLAIRDTLATCRTFLIDATLGHSLPAVLDQLDPNAQRCAPPEPTGIVWLSTPLQLPTTSGHSQRIDAVSWLPVDVELGDGTMALMWAHDGDGYDELYGHLRGVYQRRHGEPRPEPMHPFRLSSVVVLPTVGSNGPLRLDIGDRELDGLIAAGLDLVHTNAPGAVPICSAIWGTLTGQLGSIDSGGARAVAHAEVDPNRAAVKRARHQGRDPRVHTVSMGVRYRPTGPAIAPGTGSPLMWQAYTPGYYRRPRGTGADHPRTEWVPGFWRGDPSLPVSENSTVYVARAPRAAAQERSAS